ncbi:hypothetical protein OEB99_04520 [Actinotalea sp. M2MS4P-6]|uniref:hypothetical protein n=1 Tax=Actinotalea sp. M2MS4P-6 TaxID=2983762 RepID=UPI0021E469E3|nr:hypothetical protein [Actinotalea sp. M2MS4P-6]MCV2393564.1 hypothetical protein [Actinotalea sp. M2MS4P-6]
MTAEWVAASVRARAMARRRAGAGACRAAALCTDLQAALDVLSTTPVSAWLDGVTTPADADRHARADLLWTMRVLAGWVPARGTRVLRALAAGVERAEILVRAAALDQAAGAAAGTASRSGLIAPAAEVPVANGLELGALATAWPRLRRARSADELDAALRHSPWGAMGDATERADVLTAVWLRRVAREATPARPWATGAAALLVARLVLLGQPVPTRLPGLVRGLVGDGWTRARDADGLRDSLPHALRPMLDDVDGPQDLWRAEARFRERVHTDGLTMLRGALPGPPVVVGAVAVLAVDAWRVRAALTSAWSGGPDRAPAGLEVLDAVA